MKREKQRRLRENLCIDNLVLCRLRQVDYNAWQPIFRYKERPVDIKSRKSRQHSGDIALSSDTSHLGKAADISIPSTPAIERDVIVPATAKSSSSSPESTPPVTPFAPVFHSSGHSNTSAIPKSPKESIIPMFDVLPRDTTGIESWREAITNTHVIETVHNVDETESVAVPSTATVDPRCLQNTVGNSLLIAELDWTNFTSQPLHGSPFGPSLKQSCVADQGVRTDSLLPAFEFPDEQHINPLSNSDPLSWLSAPISVPSSSRHSIRFGMASRQGWVTLEMPQGLSWSLYETGLPSAFPRPEAPQDAGEVSIGIHENGNDADWLSTILRDDGDFGNDWMAERQARNEST